VREPTEAERRPYAELVVPVAPEAAASPGIWLEVANPAQLLSKLPDAIQTKPGLQPFKDITALASGALGADISAVIDLSQPFDVAMPLSKAMHDPPVLAFRVRSPEAVERGQAGLTLRRVAAGIWLLGDQTSSSPTEENEQTEEEEQAPEDEEGEMAEAEPVASAMPCLLAHAPPPVGYRVLCGPRLDLVQSVARFLLRPQPAPIADIHAELAGPAYRDVIDKALSQVKAESNTEGDTLSGSDKFGQQAGLAIVRTLGAHERVSLDVNLGAQGAELQLDVAFPESPATAELQRWALSTRGKQLPPSFARLPGDNGFALSFVGLGKETTSTLLPLLMGEISRDMAQEFVLSVKELHELNEAFLGVVPADAHFSVAAGADVDAIEGVLHSDAVRQADATGHPLAPAAIKLLQEALGGWIAIGVDVPPKEYLPAIERMLRADAIPMRRRPGMPRKDSEREDSQLRRRPVSTRGLPSGTIHVLDTVRPAKTYRPPVDGSEPPILPYDGHWLVVPDGQRVWIVGARSEALATAHASSVLNGGNRLAEQPGIQKAAERPLLAAFSYSLAGMRLQSLDWDSVFQRDMARLQFRLFGKLLHTAKTPMLVTIEAVPHAPNASGFGLRANLHVDEAALLEVLDMSSPGLPPPP
jgi:hypothetical protein